MFEHAQRSITVNHTGSGFPVDPLMAHWGATRGINIVRTE